jgi:hypothetical protein
MFRPYRREGGNPARPVWLPGLVARHDQCFPLRKSVAKVWAIEDRTAAGRDQPEFAVLVEGGVGEILRSDEHLCVPRAVIGLDDLPVM